MTNDDKRLFITTFKGYQSFLQDMKNQKHAGVYAGRAFNFYSFEAIIMELCFSEVRRNQQIL